MSLRVDANLVSSLTAFVRWDGNWFIELLFAVSVAYWPNFSFPCLRRRRFNFNSVFNGFLPSSSQRGEESSSSSIFTRNSLLAQKEEKKVASVSLLKCPKRGKFESDGNLVFKDIGAQKSESGRQCRMKKRPQPQRCRKRTTTATKKKEKERDTLSMSFWLDASRRPDVIQENGLPNKMPIFFSPPLTKKRPFFHLLGEKKKWNSIFVKWKK